MVDKGMVNKGINIIEERIRLHNLQDQAAAKQKDLNYLNEQIEKEIRELRSLEMILKVDRAIEELNSFTKVFKDEPKLWNKEKLKGLHKDMCDEEIDMLYERLHQT